MVVSMILFCFLSMFSGELLFIHQLVAQKKQERQVLEQIKEDAVYFPIKNSNQINYTDSYGGERNFLGKRTHEGCDLMSKTNIRGEIPVFSMSDGVIENKGWLTLGGWRVGIRSKHGMYFYYAHLDSYAKNIEIGQSIYAGQLLGFMGDSGYGEEGTIGQFAVHLHLGIYDTEDHSVNPYEILKELQENEKEKE